ncbi:hypothetical protein GCM10028805_08130 [Spirosoma harenae]
MKTTIRSVIHLWIAFLTTCPLLAQTSSWSGQITYEVAQKLDALGFIFKDDKTGEEMKPGDPNFPTDAPNSRVFGQKVAVLGKYAKETRDGQNTFVLTDTKDGVTQTRSLPPPFIQQFFVDLSDRKTITVLTIGEGKNAKMYQAEAPIQQASDWQFTDQTRKIAGFTCRKATVSHKKETYTIWVTTELPITYSPIHQLTPELGVVLLIESSKEQFKATKVSTTAPDAASATPTTQAQVVSREQLNDLRQKAMADFQQQLHMNDRN